MMQQATKGDLAPFFALRRASPPVCMGPQAPSTQDAGRDRRTNWNIFPLMLLACSVDTPIHINRSHLLASRCASHPESCVDWASEIRETSRTGRVYPTVGPGVTMQGI